MKNLKLLAASIVAGSLFTSSSQANKIEGAYMGIGLGNLGAHVSTLQATTIDTYALSYKIAAEYAFNFYDIVLSPEFAYTYNSIKSLDDDDKNKGSFEASYFGLNPHQFFGKLNIGYDFGGFALFANVGFVTHAAKKSELIVKDKNMISSFGLSWGFKGMYNVAKNVTLGAGIDFNSFSLTKDVKDLTPTGSTKTYGKLRNNSFDFINTYMTVSYNF